MLDSNHLIGFGVLTVPPATVVQTDHLSDDDNLDTYEFAAVALGAASETRQIAVGVVAFDSGNNAITGVTLGGNGMAERAQTPTNETVAGIYQLAVPAGTSATIVVTLSNAAQSCGIIVWALDTLQSATPTDTDSAIDANPMVDFLNVAAGGVAVAVSGSGGGPTAAAWAGLTEGHEENIAGTGAVITGAAQAFAAAQSGLTIGPTYSGGSSADQAIAMAAWR
jgi:hypothetical protein